jgi:hypothetical protein
VVDLHLSPQDLRGWSLDDIYKANAFMDMRIAYQQAHSVFSNKAVKETKADE